MFSWHMDFDSFLDVFYKLLSTSCAAISHLRQLGTFKRFIEIDVNNVTVEFCRSSYNARL